MESTHPIFNQLLRCYENVYGGDLKKYVIKDFLFEKTSFILDTVNETIEAISNTKRPNTNKREKFSKQIN